MQLRKIIIAGFLLAGQFVNAQKNDDVIQYINTYKELAIEEMQRTGVPASIKLAQGIHETEAGKSELVLKSNNHFGIKCKVSWNGDRVYHDDDARNECFRSYTSSAASYIDHSDFLKNSERYAFLFQLDPTDYKAWAYGLKKAGYATNIRYSQILIKLIEDYDLQKYTLIAMGKLSRDEYLTSSKKPDTETTLKTMDFSGPDNSLQDAPLSKPNYPSGEFIINNTRVVYAKAGTSLILLARQYEVPLGRLLDFNDLRNEDVLIEDQLMYLQRKRKSGASEFHIVQPGENLYAICQAEGIRLESLLHFNHLQLDMRPAAGETLFLQSTAPARPALADKLSIVSSPVNLNTNDRETSVNYTTHIVNSQETLYTISKKYGVEVEKIKEWNKLSDNSLKKGQELIIYKN